MQQRVKLTKRQIKEDSFTTFMLKSRRWLLDNWQFVVIGAVAVVLVITAVIYYANSQTAKRHESAARYARALLDYRAGNNQVAIMSLSQILEDYGGTEVAAQAAFMLGKINYSVRNYPEAIRHFEMYLSDAKGTKLKRAGALAGIGASNEDQGIYAEAARYFVQAYEEYPDGPLAGDYQTSAMRNLLEAGLPDQAAERLEMLREEFPDTELLRRSERLFNEKSPG